MNIYPINSYVTILPYIIHGANLEKYAGEKVKVVEVFNENDSHPYYRLEVETPHGIVDLLRFHDELEFGC